MKDKNLIKIEVHNKISVDFIEDFKSSLKGICNVEVEKPEEEISNVTGEIFNDIIIYFHQHFSELTLHLLVIGLTKLHEKLIKNSSNTSKTNKISLRHRVNDKTVEFELDPNLSENVKESIIHKSFEQTYKQDLLKITSNPKYLLFNNDFKSSKFTYNQETGLWVPLDYGSIRTEIEKSQKEIEENTDF